MNSLSFRIAERKDFDLIFKVFEQAPNYFMKVEGKLATPEKVPYEFESRPNHIPLDKKRTYLVFKDSEPVGYIDTILDHPSHDSACIGLFLLIEKYQQKGLGADIYRNWEHFFIKSHPINFIRLWVAETNDVMGFWKKQGYQFNGIEKEYKAATQTVKTYELDKRFPTPPPE